MEQQVIANDKMMKLFEFDNVPKPLVPVSAKFYEAAASLCALIKPGSERDIALRKLLEAKDAAERAALHPDN